MAMKVVLKGDDECGDEDGGDRVEWLILRC